MKRPPRFSRSASVCCLTLAGVLVPGLVSAAPAQIAIASQPCLRIPLPLPSGGTFRPADDFNTSPDYTHVHSSTNLQGQPATEKFAAGLFWFPGPLAPKELSYFQSAVAVTNPDPVASTGVKIYFYDLDGNPVDLPTVFVLGPESTQVVPASPLYSGIGTTTPGLGSARIVGDLPIVGESVHHARFVDLRAFSGGHNLEDPEFAQLGLNSLQQIQMRQEGKSTLWFGPMPVSNNAPLDFLTGNAPLIWIVNPNTSSTTVTLRYVSSTGALLPPVTKQIPAYGAMLDQTLWNHVLPMYLAPSISFDEDFRVVVSADQPILGDALMVDLFAGNSLDQGGRFRMGSAMLANTPSPVLINPELTFETGPPSVETIVGLLNPTNEDVGPVTVQYFDRNGTLLGADSFASFPRGAMKRIGPGLAASPNYPAAGVFAGWMRIVSCIKGLVGWTMRQGGEGEGDPSGASRKVWGEELTGGNGKEPGPGFTVAVGNDTFVRKVSPLVRSWNFFPYGPGYTTWVNDGAANAGKYEFRFFDHLGANVTTAAGQFAGLRFGATSSTYEDPLVSTSAPIILSGRVDTTNGGFDGIHVIGDPFWEWGIFFP